MSHLGKFGQLRPYQAPVVGAQFAARDDALGDALDGDAERNRDGAQALDPLVDGRWRHAQQRCKTRLTTNNICSSNNCITHTRIIRHSLIHCQAQ